MDDDPRPMEAAVLERLTDLVEPDHHEPVTGLAKAYLHRLPPQCERDPDTLAAHVHSLFEFIHHRDSDIAVRVFNPTIDTHGYASVGTVIEINVADSPFLLDSVTAEIEEHGVGVSYVVHPVIGVDRDGEGHLQAVRPARHTITRESVQHYELNRELFEADLPGLERSIRGVVESVRKAVSDFHPMMSKIDRMIDLARIAAGPYPEADVEEAVAFLQWLRQDNFVFLGYREYRLVDTPEGKAVEVLPETGLGILTQVGEPPPPKLLADLQPELAARYLGGDLLVITKTNRTAPVHRRAKMDYLGVRIVDPDGSTAGEARMIGLFTSKAYMEPSSRTPILRRKLQAILAAEDLIEGSHDHKAMIELFEDFSKHDLFSAPTEELRHTLAGLLALQERHQVKLFVRRDLLERSVSILVALPRDRFNAALRRRLQDLFMARFGGTSVDYHLALGDSDPAQIHFTVWVESGDVPEVDYEELEAEVAALTRTWKERVGDHLSEGLGPSEATRLVDEWCDRFPEYYAASTTLEVSVADIINLDRLDSGDRHFVVGIHNEPEGGPGEPLTRIALYRAHGKLPLSELLPALENLGLQVIEEVPTRLSGGGFFIHDFGVLGADGKALDVEDVGERLEEALERAWGGQVESDPLDRLVITAGLRQHQVHILRAYGTYWRRVTPVFTIAYVNDTLCAHPAIAAELVQLFELRFDPDQTGEGYDALHALVVSELDAVPSLDEDRILRAFLRLIDATVRTNAYQPDRPALAFKFVSGRVPDMPAPVPMAEIYVTSRWVEGVHLRGGMVARGGIRWSTRREDYRTEVLGLMKAQMTKNAVIVPTGAKGGFVLRRPPEDPMELRAEVERQYRVFIGRLLDVTDNLVEGAVVHPERTRIHDGEDPYLVVAADKGTATFSDIANQIAAEHRFWLDDAFASGGSSGYDHKALGITARGAWKSLERHFMELGIDPAKDEFTVVGIGDMSGDVFGNGMLLSSTLKLVAAFDHRHILIDPDPDPAASHAERRRLFETPRSSWADYDPSLISEGGGVWPRSAKRIELSEAARHALGTEQEEFTPNQLIRTVLLAPVDLLWNGGIGTYVKASYETHEDAGDRFNDAVRVDGKDLRCRVVVEGGNLGLTQHARIEYAKVGGRINTDFIDNSGGVDCSDREVNLKILLGMAEERGELDRAGRDALIAEVVDEVVDRILYDNFQQAQILSQEEQASPRRMEAYEELMVALEEEGLVDRALEALPSTELMGELNRSGEGLTRPSLSVLLANAKRSLEDALRRSSLPDSEYLLEDLRGYFPSRVVEGFGHLLPEHPLRRQLLSTIVANDVVNSEGIVFVSRVCAQTGATAPEVVSAYRIARDVSGAVDRWEQIEDLFGRIDLEVWTSLMQATDRMVASLTRWYLAHANGEPMGEVIARCRPLFVQLEEAAATCGTEEWNAQREGRMTELVAAGVPEPLARSHTILPVLASAGDVIEVSQAFDRSPADTLEVFLHIGAALGIDRLTQGARRVVPGDRWGRWALWAVEQDLLAVRRQAAEAVLASADGRPGEKAVDHFLASNPERLGRLMRFMRALDSGPPNEIAPLLVALRQVRAAVS